VSVTPSPIGGFAAQFFDNNGVILSGGKIYTYAAGTTTPQASYTSAAGVTAHANPIILDSAGRVPGGEIWLTDGLIYKFVIETALSVLIGTYDNITGVNSNFVNYTVQEEVITATAGQTVFNLSTINYTPGTNSLSVYIDGVNQYVGDSYLETDSDTVTFTSGVHVGGEVKFTTALQTTTAAIPATAVAFTGFKGQIGSVQDLADNDGSDWVGFIASGTGAVARSAQDKMRDEVNITDFMTAADIALVRAGSTVDVTYAGTAAIATGKSVYWPQGLYTVSPIGASIGGSEPNRTSLWVLGNNQTMRGDGAATRLVWGTPATKQFFFKIAAASNVTVRDMSFASGYGAVVIDPTADGGVSDVTVQDCFFTSNLIDVCGGRQPALYANSKYSLNVTVRGCVSNSVAVHSILFTNTYNAKALGNTFNNVTGGFCVDCSQGTIGALVSNNTANNIKYFCKVESSFTGTPVPIGESASSDVVITGNVAQTVSQYAVLLNTGINRIIVSNNVFVDCLIYGIATDTVDPYTQTGACIIGNNVIRGNNTTASVGIRAYCTGASEPYKISGNIIDNVLIGVDVVGRVQVENGRITSSANCVRFSTTVSNRGAVVSGVEMTSTAGVCIGVVGAATVSFEQIKITNNRMTFFTGAILVTGVSTINGIISSNVCTCANTGALYGIYLLTPKDTRVCDNVLNVIAAAAINSVKFATSHTNCFVTGNIAVHAISLDGAAGTTISTPNLLTATYNA